jgi:hypothetical protein
MQNLLEKAVYDREATTYWRRTAVFTSVAFGVGFTACDAWTDTWMGVSAMPSAGPEWIWFVMAVFAGGVCSLQMRRYFLNIIDSLYGYDPPLSSGLFSQRRYPYKLICTRVVGMNRALGVLCLGTEEMRFIPHGQNMERRWGEIVMSPLAGLEIRPTTFDSLWFDRILYGTARHGIEVCSPGAAHRFQVPAADIALEAVQRVCAELTQEPPRRTPVDSAVEVLRTARRSTSPTPQGSSPENDVSHNVEEAIVSALGGPELARWVAALAADRHATMQRAKLLGWVPAALVILYVSLVPLPRALELPGGAVRNGVLSWLFFFTVLVTNTLRNVAVARLVNPTRVVLVLRRFRKPDKRYTVLAHEVGEAGQGLAVPITIQDSSFRGSPAMVVSVIRDVLFQLGAILLLFLGMRLVPLGGLRGVAMLVATWAAVLWLIYRVADDLIKRYAARRTTEADFRQVLQDVFRRIRHRRGLYRGTRVLKFPDSVWQRAIEVAVREADAVLIDVTDVSEAVAWEIRTVQQQIPPESVVLTWSEADEQRLEAGLMSPREVPTIQRMPEQVSDSLLRIVPAAWLARCQAYPYRQSRGPIGDDWRTRGSLSLALCMAIAQRDRLRTPRRALFSGARGFSGR